MPNDAMAFGPGRSLRVNAKRSLGDLNNDRPGPSATHSQQPTNAPDHPTSPAGSISPTTGFPSRTMIGRSASGGQLPRCSGAGPTGPSCRTMASAAEESAADEQE